MLVISLSDKNVSVAPDVSGVAPVAVAGVGVESLYVSFVNVAAAARVGFNVVADSDLILFNIASALAICSGSPDFLISSTIFSASFTDLFSCCGCC